MNIKYLKFLLLPLLLLSAFGIRAQPSISLNQSNQLQLDEFNLWYQVQALDRTPSFEELVHLHEQSEPVNTTLGGRGAYLTKIEVSHERQRDLVWFINISANYLDIGTAYWQTDRGEVLALESFGQVDSASPRLAHTQVFSLPLAGNERGTLWIYLQAKVFAVPAYILAMANTEFYNTQFIINSMTSMTYAVMMTLAIIALFVYFRTGYWVTLACAGYIGIQGLGWFIASGNFGHLIPASSNLVYLGILLFPFAIASASQFTKLLFNCSQDHPKLTIIFNSLAILCLILGIIMPFLSFYYAFIIAHIIAVIWIPLCLGTGIFMLRKRDFRAKYYFVGNALYSFSMVLFVLSHIYHFHWGVSFEVIVQIALTIDCICILLSLSEWLQLQQKEYRRSYEISRIDSLTKIGNRFSQNEKLASLTGSYCIAFIDLDGFKKINDELGHNEGDKILVFVAKLLQKKLTGVADIFRCGGDEFTLVVELQEAHQSGPLIERLTKILEETEKELQQNGWSGAGLSFGIATSTETQNQSACLSLADERMYKYKQSRKKAV